MALTKHLARDYTIEVETDTPGSYTAIGGLISWAQSPGKVDAETTTFDSGGVAEHLPAERSLQITLEGRYLEDADDGSRDPGQERVEAIAGLVGTEGLSHLRITAPGGVVKTFEGSFDVTDGGGGSNDASSWQTVFTRSGPTVTT